MALRVLILTQWFEPEPTFKGLAFARQLVALGLDVEVVTGFPNYPGGHLYPGYRIRWRRTEMMDGVRVTRVALYPSHDRSVARRIVNYLSFALSSFLFALLFVRRIDVVYAYHPPLSVGFAAVMLKVFRRWRVVLDIQDLWPDTLRATGMVGSDRVLGFIGYAARWVYDRSDHIVVLSEGFRRLLVARGVAEGKLDVIPNWADELKLSVEGVPTLWPTGTENSFNILFAGNIGSAQALGVVLDAAEILANKGSRVRFLFMGKGVDVPSLQADARRRDLSNVTFLPAVPMEAVGPYLKAADALLVHLKPDELFEITIPSKTQAYMAAGRPILMAVGGEAADLVARARCGVLARSGNAASLADAAQVLASMSVSELASMGDNGRVYYDRHLSLAVGSERFKGVFHRVVFKS